MQKYFLPILTALLLFIITGCASTRDMATIKPSQDAQGAFFQSGNTDDYNFYSYSDGSTPVAYLALDKKYTLQSQFWYSAEMNKAIWTATLKERKDIFGEYDNYRASEIRSSTSEIIGYITTRFYWVTAWFAEPESTVITVPPPERNGMQYDPNRWYKDR